MAERPTLAERRGKLLSKEERLIRDSMIYHAVRVERKSQRGVARTWRLSPARVSQIVNDFARGLRDCPTVNEAVQRLASRWDDDDFEVNAALSGRPRRARAKLVSAWEAMACEIKQRGLITRVAR